MQVIKIVIKGNKKQPNKLNEDLKYITKPDFKKESNGSCEAKRKNKYPADNLFKSNLKDK